MKSELPIQLLQFFLFCIVGFFACLTLAFVVIPGMLIVVPIAMTYFHFTDGNQVKQLNLINQREAS